MTIYRLLMYYPKVYSNIVDDLGNYYDKIPVGETAEDSPSIDIAMERVRAHRNALLAACDYTQLDDAPLTPAQKEDYRDYRQALRDYPGTIDTATWSAPDWPQKPV